MDVNPILIPIIFVSSIPIVAIGYPLVRAFAIRLERKPIASPVPHEVTARLERIEQAVRPAHAHPCDRRHGEPSLARPHHHLSRCDHDVVHREDGARRPVKWELPLLARSG